MCKYKNSLIYIGLIIAIIAFIVIYINTPELTTNYKCISNVEEITEPVITKEQQIYSKTEENRKRIIADLEKQLKEMDIIE